MAIAFVQGGSTGRPGPVSTIGFTLTGVSSAALLVVTGRYASTATIAVSDDRGHTYTSDLVFASSLTAAQVWSAISTVTGDVVISLVSTLADAGRLGLAVCEFSGAFTSTRVDQTASSSGVSSNITSGNVTTTQDDCLLVGAVLTQVSTTVSAGAGYSNLIQDSTARFAMESKVVTGTVTDDADFATPQPGEWGAGVVAYFEDVGGAGATPVRLRTRTLFGVGG